MIDALNKKGYNGFAISVPSPNELQQIFILAAPVVITMMSKVCYLLFYLYLHGCYCTNMGYNIGGILLSTCVFCYFNGHTHGCCTPG